MTRAQRFCLLLAVLFPVLLAGPLATAGDPAPRVVVHVPTDEMDVLLEADRRGVVLRHDEYERLIAGARANAAERGLRPPVDGALVSARGSLDLSDPSTGRVRLDYEVSVLADGPSVVPFVVRGVALDRVEVEGEGRYEELDGLGRLRFDGAGTRRVHIEGFVAVHEKGERRLVDVSFAPAGAMALDVRVPPAVEGSAVGEGVPLPVESPAEEARTFTLQPDRSGRLRIAWGPAQRGTTRGPPVFDVQSRSQHGIEDGLIRSRVVLHVDVLGTPVQALDLHLPATMAIRAVGGKGVTGSARSEDRERLRVELGVDTVGRVTITLDGETPYEAAPDVAMPRVLLPEAVRLRAQVVLGFANGVEAHDVRVEGGRRLASQPRKGKPPLLRYALARRDGGVFVDLLPPDLRLEASSTYYLNLTEPAKSLLAAVTYHVRQGTAFELRPRFPAGYGLRSLTIDGQRTGFGFDQRSDGVVEVRLERGVPEGGEIALVATLEQAGVDWVPEEGVVSLPFALPSAGADREEGFLGIGADASFNVLDAAVEDLVAVGAAALTSRGVSPAGLVYGYRLDGQAPSVRLEIERRAPRLDATVVAWALPTPRRLTVENLVIHVVERAGVRRLVVDVPTWARDVVRIDAPDLVSASRVDAEEEGTPEGYDRWEVVLARRILGRHLVAVRYWEDQDEDDWRVPADRPLAVRVPVERVERSVVVARAPGLEVGLEGDAEPRDLAELPPEAAMDPLSVREVVRLLPDMPGPGIVVRKHEGAPVLDAIAPLVVLRTAVAREGILRTRAEVVLVNIGLQFVRVQLPPGSELIGAVVDGESVKPLSDPDGVLRIPVPPAHRCGGRTVATLTYETRLGEEAVGEVEIPAPEFPGLEVLETTHQVAFDPGVEIREVRGDYGGWSTRSLAPTCRKPFLLRMLGAVRLSTKRSVGTDAATVGAPASQPSIDPSSLEGMHERADEEDESWKTEEAPVFAAEKGVAQQVERESQIAGDRAITSLQQEQHEAQDKLRQQVEQLQKLSAEVRRLNTAGAVAPQVRQILVPMRYETIEERQADGRVVTRRVAVMPPSVRMEIVPGLREPSDPSPPPPPGASMSLPAPDQPAPTTAVPPPAGLPMADPWAAGGQAVGGGGPVARPRPGGEGPDPTATPTPTPPRPPRRKGLLSLDVPVLLSPNVVTAERLGGGGSMTVAVVPARDVEAGYWFAVLVSLACGLALATRDRLSAVLVPLLGFVLAALVALVFREDAGFWPAALADAASVLILLLALRWLVGQVTRRPAAAIAATAAVLLAAFVLVSTPALADEAEADVVEIPRTVYVPYDPDDPDVPRADDRVFLPLETYLALRRIAHPDEDPDVLAKGKAVSLIGATHRLRIGKEEATGALVLGFAKRGKGLSLVPLPFGGLAVSHATLDGDPIPLLLQDGVYQVPLEEEGDHLLEIEFRAPVVQHAHGRRVAFDVVPFAGTLLDVAADAFDGELEVAGAGAVIPQASGTPGNTWRVHLGGLSHVEIELVDPRGADPEVALRTRVESRVIHSIRDGGTESRVTITLHVLQGQAEHLDVDLPAGVSVLHAGGPAVARWETAEGRIRLVFARPQEGTVEVQLVVSRATDDPTRVEELPALAVRDTTGERGVVVVNGDPFLRVEPTATEGLLRTATPRGDRARGPDKAGRVAGAWHFATRPTRFAVRVEEAPEGLAIDTRAAVVFGDDHVRSRFEATIRVDERVPVGDFVFDLPGDDEVRSLTGTAVSAWWTEGEGEARTLHVRQQDLRRGDQQLVVQLERRLGGKRDAVAVPRWRLRGAKRDRGELQLFALTDVDPDPGRLPGLRSVPIVQRHTFRPPVPGATLQRAFTWEEPFANSLPVTLRSPPLEADAVVVTSVHPGDESHRLEHLVLFDVRRGLTDQFDVFVPDSGMPLLDVVRTRDLSEVRRHEVKRRGPDGVEVKGTLYEIHVQSARSGIVEITISQVQRPDLPVRVVRPERVVGEGDAERDVKAVQWFGLVRTFLDGEMDVHPVGEPPDQAEWADLPFLPVGIQRQDVWKFFSARAPYVLDVEAHRRQLKAQSGAVVRSVQADIVLGRDGQARVRVRYRLFNRRRQFLAVRLPAHGVLFGVTVAGRPVKPMEGPDGDLLIPVPKVPVGVASYPVSVLYRAPAGPRFPRGALDVVLPEVEGPTVDRTVVRLFVPRGYEYDVETDMEEAEAEEVAADLAEAAVREAKKMLDVAQSGTLEQRQRATQSAAALWAEANDLNVLAGNKHAALGREVQQVRQDLDEKLQSVVEDTQASKREATGTQLDFFAGNAAPILAGRPAQQGQTGAVGRATTANWNAGGQWFFNPAQVGAVGTKQEIAQLKQRLGKVLDARAQQSIVQDFDVQIAQAADIAQTAEAQVDATWRNFASLNDVLLQEQQKSRQLGVVAQPQVDLLRWLASEEDVQRLANLDDVTNGLEDRTRAGYDSGGGGYTTGAALNPSSGFYFGSAANPYGVPFGVFGEPSSRGTSADTGIFFNEGCDGSYQARVENLFDVLLGDVGVDVRGLGGQGRTRQGLMGVDVSLPQDGKVYLFRSLKAGSPIRITVSERGLSPLVRWLLFGVCLAGLAAVLVGLGRWRAARLDRGATC